MMEFDSPRNLVPGAARAISPLAQKLKELDAEMAYEAWLGRAYKAVCLVSMAVLTACVVVATVVATVWACRAMP